jgi:hypothetical protein
VHVTLNITLLAIGVIYQSADFRLTDASTNKLISDSSTKVVTLQYPNWHGFVTYTGVGRWHRRDTSQWIVDWLQGNSDAKLEDAIDALSVNGTKWLDDIRRATRTRHKHTFIVASFVESVAQLTVVSNFEDCAGRSDSNPAAGLSASGRRFLGRPVVTLTGGGKAAVSRQQRRQLERLAQQHPEDPARLRNALSRLNATAAKSPLARGAISPECSVLSMRADGQGFHEVSDTSKIEPRTIMYGMPAPDLKQLGLPLGRFVGGSFARSAARQPELQPCRPRIVKPSRSARYELVELSDPEYETSTARAINEHGAILGAGTKEGNRGEYWVWSWEPAAGMTKLPLVCSGGIIGVGLNDVGQAALSVAMADGSGHACRWDGTSAVDLGTFGGRDSAARQINDQGVIAGWVCIHPEERGQMNFRPAAWSPHNALEVLTDLPADWGEAVDVNSGGLVLVLAYSGGLGGQPQALLWRPGGSCVRVGGDRGIGVFPIGINDAGKVLGSANDASGRSIALIAHADGQWGRLGTAPGWHVTAMNSTGDIAGTVLKDGFSRPWLRRSSGEIVLLPYFAYHHCRPFALNARGDIVGQAATDHGTHALLWRTSE